MNNPDSFHHEKLLLACIAEDGAHQIERNIFSEDGCWDSIEQAWQRNDGMGSRWIFYPYRVIVDQATNLVVSVADNLPTEWVGKDLQEVKTLIEEEPFSQSV